MVEIYFLMRKKYNIFGADFASISAATAARNKIIMKKKFRSISFITSSSYDWKVSGTWKKGKKKREETLVKEDFLPVPMFMPLWESRHITFQHERERGGVAQGHVVKGCVQLQFPSDFFNRKIFCQNRFSIVSCCLKFRTQGTLSHSNQGKGCC